MAPLVLVVDDNDDAREMLAAVLQVAGYRAVEAASGPEAVEAARRHAPAVIFMDIFMPGLDGVEASRQIKSDPRLRDIPIIAWTGRAVRPDGEDGLFERTLVKPCPPDLVLECVRALAPRADPPAPPR